MKTVLHIREKYSFAKDFIEQLPDNFRQMGEELYTGRNEIRKLEVNGTVFVVKYFKKITLANRFIYGNFRKSKARRAYEHTEKLLSLGIKSPEQVGYVDCYQYGMLIKSFYVSLYSDYKSLLHLLSLPLSEAEEGLKAFAKFTYTIHQKGVFHYDYSENNVLYAHTDEGYDFSLIDNNRMRLSKYTPRKGALNVMRLAIPVDFMGIVAAEYAREMGVNELRTLNAMVKSRFLFKAKKAFKTWIKIPVLWFREKFNDSKQMPDPMDIR